MVAKLDAKIKSEMANDLELIVNQEQTTRTKHELQSALYYKFNVTKRNRRHYEQDNEWLVIFDKYLDYLEEEFVDIPDVHMRRLTLSDQSIKN